MWLGLVDLNRIPIGTFFGASTLVRKWLAKMTKMAVLAKITKMTQIG